MAHRVDLDHWLECHWQAASLFVGRQHRIQLIVHIGGAQIHQVGCVSIGEKSESNTMRICSARTLPKIKRTVSVQPAQRQRTRSHIPKTFAGLVSVQPVNVASLDVFLAGFGCTTHSMVAVPLWQIALWKYFLSKLR